MILFPLYSGHLEKKTLMLHSIVYLVLFFVMSLFPSVVKGPFQNNFFSSKLSYEKFSGSDFPKKA